MDFVSRIAAIEAALAEREIPVDLFCTRAGVSRASWQRWKARQTFPNGRLWLRVEQTVRTLGLLGSDAVEESIGNLAGEVTEISHG